MSKFASYQGYPEESMVGAEAALLTAWASLHRFHEDLVLVGGLAVKYLTKAGDGMLPGAVTMDVDLGVALLAAGGGAYGSMKDDLEGQGFQCDREKGRYYRRFGQIPVFIDFLTEDPRAIGVTTGSVLVDDVPANVFPGVARALATRQNVVIEGRDLYGVKHKVQIPVSGVGALLVLKLNAFAGRQQPKDAYDVLLCVSRHLDGPAAAIAAFKEEANAGNTGYAGAVAALQAHFTSADQSGPRRAAAFVLEGQAVSKDLEARRKLIQEQMVTIGQALAPT